MDDAGRRADSRRNTKRGKACGLGYADLRGGGGQASLVRTQVGALANNFRRERYQQVGRYGQCQCGRGEVGMPIPGKAARQHANGMTEMRDVCSIADVKPAAQGSREGVERSARSTGAPGGRHPTRQSDQIIEPRAVLAANDYQMVAQRALLPTPGMAGAPTLSAEPLPLSVVRTYLDHCQANISAVKVACNYRG